MTTIAALVAATPLLPGREIVEPARPGARYFG
jgi:hypothetical protein